MKLIFAIALTAFYGLTMRLFYGFLDSFMGIMSVSFLVVLPMLIGFLTILFIPLRTVSNGTSAFFIPWLTCFVILFITLLFEIEGAICWIMLFPLFAILAGLGGLIAYNIKRKKEDEDPHIDDWQSPDKLKISLILLAAPLVLGFLEGDRMLSSKHMTITKEIVIQSAATNIWQKIIARNETAPAEKQTRLSNFLGFPRHLQTTLDVAAIEGKRKAIYENGLTFDEVITKYEENKSMVLAIKTDASKIPPTVLDEHIVIGGKHIDLLEDTYNIEQLPDGSCKVSLSSKFVITTPFNWYAGIWSKFLMSDLLSGELKLLKQRTEGKKL